MKIENYIKKLESIIARSEKKDRFETELAAASALARIYYDYNQFYSDEKLERALISLKERVLIERDYSPDANCVLFYDGFGFDLRGWAASYVRALVRTGLFVVYACPASSEGKIPHIIAEMNPQRSRVVYLDKNQSRIEIIREIDSIFADYKPGAAFFYTTPDDVAAAIAFSNNVKTKRYQVDLTDHAFWIGVNALDYSIECREMGASLAVYERKIPKEKILKLDCAPYINREKNMTPLPFDIYHEKYVFTGGALYKTLGDADLLYYQTIRYILDNFPDYLFLYAGSGDTSEINKILMEYPGRAFFIPERTDFFEIIRNSVLYINTYPMFGGLMMRYAALAQKIPVTLKHDHDSDGILINQEKLGIEFDDFLEFKKEIFHLLSDEEYRRTKEDAVKNSVINEEQFSENLKMVIEKQTTMYSFDEIKQFDTSAFRNEYKKRISESQLYKAIATKENRTLFMYFPKAFYKTLLYRVEERLHK